MEDRRPSRAASGPTKDLVSYRSQPGKDLKLKEVTVNTIDSAVDSVKVERVCASTVGRALAQKDGFVSGVSEMMRQFRRQVLR